MRFLLLNQTFHPDVVATAQYLSELASGLCERGHQVTVIASRRGYDKAEAEFASREQWRGVEIRRVRATRFGKKAKWRRAADFASFVLSCCLELLRVRRPDVVIALTSPPLISFVAACYAMVRRCRFAYWVMDLNPDEAVAAGWLKENSLITRALDALSRFSLRRADSVIVLDRFMRDRILAKGIPADRITVLPPWSHDEAVRFDPQGRDEFRREHGLEGKFVVMYSGNHSPCHPLDTVLHAARDMQADDSVAFCFVGGGSEFAKVKNFAAEHRLSNIRCLPYQPLSRLAASLSAADVHVVVMGAPFIGMIHPCKVYNAMRVAPGVLYVGPRESHVTDILGAGSERFGWVQHGDCAAAVQAIRRIRSSASPAPAFTEAAAPFAQSKLLPRLISILERLA
jgi:colanic acid biosynthesis glycosyl transferase WcaI